MYIRSLVCEIISIFVIIHKNGGLLKKRSTETRYGHYHDKQKKKNQNPTYCFSVQHKIKDQAMSMIGSMIGGIVGR